MQLQRALPTHIIDPSGSFLVRVARPYRNNEQSYIESFNRTLRKECLGWQKYPVSDLKEYREMLESFLQGYRCDRPHLGAVIRPHLVPDNLI
jgi:hypothetical protein